MSRAARELPLSRGDLDDSVRVFDITSRHGGRHLTQAHNRHRNQGRACACGTLKEANSFNILQQSPVMQWDVGLLCFLPCIEAYHNRDMVL